MFTQTALAFELRGAWYRLEGYYTERPIEFTLIGDQYRTSTKEFFYLPRRVLSHTIDQYVSLIKTGSKSFEGSASFYDSRGCTFRDLPVRAEAESENVIGILMTVPRYKFRTVKKASTGEVLRTECRVLEYVEAPIKLYRY